MMRMRWKGILAGLKAGPPPLVLLYSLVSISSTA